MATRSNSALPHGDLTPVDYEATTPVEPQTWTDVYELVLDNLNALRGGFTILVDAPADLATHPEGSVDSRVAIAMVDADGRPRQYVLAPADGPGAVSDPADPPDGAVEGTAHPVTAARRWWLSVLAVSPVDGSGNPIPPTTAPPAPQRRFSFRHENRSMDDVRDYRATIREPYVVLDETMAVDLSSLAADGDGLYTVEVEAFVDWRRTNLDGFRSRYPILEVLASSDGDRPEVVASAFDRSVVTEAEQVASALSRAPSSQSARQVTIRQGGTVRTGPVPGPTSGPIIGEYSDRLRVREVVRVPVVTEWSLRIAHCGLDTEAGTFHSLTVTVVD